MSDDSDPFAIGCLIVLILIGWGIWELCTGCYLCGDSRLTKSCATIVLKEKCGQSREIQSVVDIGDAQRWFDKQGNQVGFTARNVIYEFKKRPAPDEVVSAMPLRSTALFMHEKDGWNTVCELGP